MSLHGLVFLSQQEGCILHVYDDANDDACHLVNGKWVSKGPKRPGCAILGHATVGVGHLMRPGENYPNGITHDQAIGLLEQDTSAVERWITNHAQHPTQNQFDAMCSLAFNIGIGHGGFPDSTVLRMHNAGNATGAAIAFEMWDKRLPYAGELIQDEVTGGMREPRPGELVPDARLLARRKLEGKLYLTPDGVEFTG